MMVAQWGRQNPERRLQIEMWYCPDCDTKPEEPKKEAAMLSKNLIEAIKDCLQRFGATGWESYAKTVLEDIMDVVKEHEATKDYVPPKVSRPWPGCCGMCITPDECYDRRCDEECLCKVCFNKNVITKLIRKVGPEGDDVSYNCPRCEDDRDLEEILDPYNPND